jgi:ankyrin repeat protein
LCEEINDVDQRLELNAAQAALAAGDVEGLALLLKTDTGLAADDAGLLTGLVLTMPPVDALEDMIALLAIHGAELTDPLKVASGCGNIRAVTKLLDLGGDIDGKGRWSPLEEALYWGAAEVVPLMLQRGAVVDNLSKASGVGDMERVARCFDDTGKLTAAAGEIAWPFNNDTIPAEVRRDQQELLGNALVYAASWGRVEVAKYLLGQGAPVNLVPAGFDYSGTPLHSAAFNGHREMVDLLLSHGADPALRDTKIDKLAEDWAAHSGHSNLAEYLQLVRQGTV